MNVLRCLLLSGLFLSTWGALAWTLFSVWASFGYLNLCLIVRLLRSLWLFLVAVFSLYFHCFFSFVCVMFCFQRGLIETMAWRPSFCNLHQSGFVIHLEDCKFNMFGLPCLALVLFPFGP